MAGSMQLDLMPRKPCGGCDICSCHAIGLDPVKAEFLVWPDVSAARHGDSITYCELVKSFPRHAVFEQHAVVVRTFHHETASRRHLHGRVVVDDVAIVNALLLLTIENETSRLVQHEIPHRQ